jgi:NTP pyrophosphatase (non-canonical NTP hydrolase)
MTAPAGHSILARIVKRANENGHYIVDIPDEVRAVAALAPGVFGHCSLCGAHVRYYSGMAGGEAYQTTCRNNAPDATRAITPEAQDRLVHPVPIEQLAHCRAMYRTATLNTWCDMLMDYAREKGWATQPEDSDIGTLVALMHTELSELFEEYRNGHKPNETYYNEDAPRKPEGIPSELADVIIRALHFAGIYGIDVDAIVQEKHEYNLTRPYRHGGKVV